MKHPIFYIIDLFCGAGGTTTGFVQAELDGNKLAKVIACVNHDPIAIKSHWANHPEVKHFEEDIRTLDLTELVNLTDYYREISPDAYIILWASLECTNFSNAKGGQARDADSRTLAEHLDRYVIALQPDYIQIENVVEFMSWGPLDAKGKPISKKNGSDWLKWRERICGFGYVDQWKELNSANYGAYTSRNRLFGVFARPWLPIAFPEPTHAKKPTSFSMHGDLQKWMPVKEVLDFADKGESIFNRDKPLVDKTLERIYAGLVKFVANSNTSFLTKYFSGKPKGKVNSVDDPSPTVTTFGGGSLVQTVPFIVQRNSGEAESKLVDPEGPARTITTTGGNQDLVQAQFLLKYNSTNGKTGKHVPPSINDPAPVIAAQNRLGLIQPEFLAAHYSSGDNVSSVNSPCPTISTKDRFQFIQPVSLQNQSTDQPAGSIFTNDKHRLVQAQPFIMPTNYDNSPVSIEQPSPTITANRKYHYLVNPSWFGHPTSIENPCPVIIARQDKAPLSLVQLQAGTVSIPIYDTDTPIMVAIKEFMAAYNLIDIKMRMLRVHELLKIQGFPAHYKLEGNQSDQKKFIGNSVVPLVVKKWTEAMALKIIEDKTQVA